jgi:hypothetical protein
MLFSERRSSKEESEVVVPEGSDYIQCESGVESEKEHCGSEPTEGVNEQSLVGAHL